MISPGSAALSTFILMVCLQCASLLIAKWLSGRTGGAAMAGSTLVYLSAGVMMAFAPFLFSSLLLQVLLALLFLGSGLIVSGTGRSRYLLKAAGNGLIFLSLAFLFELAVFEQSYPWIISVSMLVAAAGGGSSFIVGHFYGKRPLRTMAHQPNTLEASLAVFLVSVTILFSLSSLFSPLFGGALATLDTVMLASLSVLIALVVTGVLSLLSAGYGSFLAPLSLAYVLYVLEQGSGEMLEQFLLGGLFAFLLAILSVRVRFLTEGGAIATFLLGTTIFGIGGMVWTVPLLTFYLLSSVLSKLGRKRKARFDLVFEKGSQRDEGQVYANGGIAWVLMAVYSLSHDPAVYFAYLGTLAAVQADTWATEIGTMWPNPTARLITSFRKVPVGTSGGVSIPGTTGAFTGALFICASAMAAGPEWLFRFGAFQSLLLIGFSGLLASLVDSFFGATVQAQYFDPLREKVTERTHSIAADGTMIENRLIKGSPLVNNDLVNTFCALSGAILAWSIASEGNLF